ncbi:Uncharacterised protein [Bordetella pertussis]|nr:Uncharacterised protein [Bordetella pertussis]
MPAFHSRLDTPDAMTLEKPCRRHSRIADTATKATTMRTAATTCTSMWNVRYFTATRLTPQAAMTSSNCRYTRPTLAGDAMAVDT